MAIVLGKRIVSFELLVLWKVLYYFQGEKNRANPDLEKLPQAADFIDRCYQLGAKISEIAVRNPEPIHKWTKSQRAKFINLLLCGCAELFRYDYPKRAHQALRMARCILRYFGVRWSDRESAIREALKLLQPILQRGDIDTDERMELLAQTQFSDRHFDHWFRMGKGETEREINPIIRFFEQQSHRDNELATEILAFVDTGF